MLTQYLPCSHYVFPFSQSAMIRQNQPQFVSLSELTDDDADIDAPPAEDYIVQVGDLEGADEEDGAEDDGEPPAWFASAERIASLRVEHRRHETDCGSPEFQVAGMTERISYLTKHLKTHPKDFSTRRGLVALVNKRRRLLNYLYSQNAERYVSIIASLGIRHKIPGRVENKAEKYSRYPAQKAIKKHLIEKRR